MLIARVRVKPCGWTLQQRRSSSAYTTIFANCDLISILYEYL